MTRKVVTMLISVTVPADMTAAAARKEVRYLAKVRYPVKDGSGWNRPEDVHVKSVRPAGRENGRT